MRWFQPVKKTLVLGTGPLVVDLLAEIYQRPRCEYRVIGIVSEAPLEEAELFGHALLGAVKDVHRVILEQQPDVIIVALSLANAELSDHQLLETGLRRTVRIEHIATAYERLTGKLPIESYSVEDVVFSHTFRPAQTALLSTRLLSLAAALVGIVVLAPLMLLIAGLLKLDSDGPVLFVQERMGFRGKSFKLLKFRTMVPAVGQVSEWEEDNKDRITPVGRWLRKFRLDELPQFFNILKGDMNIVGPRPHPASNAELFMLVARNMSDAGIQIPYYALRSSVRPGMTGWAQVRYRYANNLQEEIEKLRFDLYYLKHYSLWLDLRILLETVRIVLLGHAVLHKPQPDTATSVVSEGKSSTYAQS
jgi:exopolysaccharide biosynthesis polyprenyl glycosylphosphotransferase